jgi:hypothetical protein
MGFSGARIYFEDNVVSKHHDRAEEQALYCCMLAPLCPRIDTIGNGWYSMQKLRMHLGKADDEVLADIVFMLKNHIWCRPLPWQNTGWRQLLAAWYAREIGSHFTDPMMVAKLLEKLYPVGTRYPQCMIHGDPTVANLGYDDVDNMILLDPLPPKGKMPGFATVDIGKLMQSYIGWEYVLLGQKPPDIHNYRTAKMLRGFSRLEVDRVLFWLYVHLVRILPYVKPQSAVIREWVVMHMGRLGAELMPVLEEGYGGAP